MHIRQYNDLDEPAVVALWREVFPDDPPHNNPATVVRRKGSFQRELFFVAEEESKIIGTIMAGYDGHRGWLYTVAVNPRKRRHGVGSALVRYAEAALRTLGCPKINLQVRGSNPGVAAFYQRLGYQIEDRISLGKRMPGAPVQVDRGDHDTGGEG
jgi:ribosomal protein S18 acetylase RimI-like enzyme